MNKMMVTVFTNETDGFNGLSALKDLHKDGDLTLYSQIVLEKDVNGKVSTKDVDAKGPVGTALGLTLGSLVGLLGGPVAAVAGGYGASMAGMFYDLNNAGVDAQFIDDVSEAMKNSSIAILADIEEEWMTPLDTKMMEHNGIVFRKLRYEVEEEQLQREIDLANEDIERFELELQRANEESRENIQKHIDATKEKLHALSERAKVKQENLNRELIEKIEVLDAQSNKNSDKLEQKINKKIDELKADYDVRANKLQHAWESAKSKFEDTKKAA